MSPNAIAAVFFDLDGTLRHNRPDGFESFVEYLEELGYAFTLDQLRRAEHWTHSYWADSGDLRADIAETGADTPAFWTRHTERQLHALGLAAEAETLAPTINRMFDERYDPAHHVPDDVAPALTRLRAAGYTLGLVSNRTEPLEPLAIELGLRPYFDFTLAAGEARSWKPDPGIFRRAAELAGCAPAAAVYVGDNYFADVIGARGAGLQPILIDPKGIFPQPGCPVIRTLDELDRALAGLGTNAGPAASHS
jgi:putative hydrolase of the HAD superfamily